MLHAMFRRNGPTGSGEDFQRVFIIYGRGSHLGHVTNVKLIHFHIMVPQNLHTKFG